MTHNADNDPLIRLRSAIRLVDPTRLTGEDVDALLSLVHSAYRSTSEWATASRARDAARIALVLAAHQEAE